MAANRTLHAAVDVIGVHHMHSSPPCRRDRKVRDACRCFGPAALAQGPGEEASGAVVQRGWPCLGSTIRGRTGTVLQTAGAKTYADFLSASLRLQGQSATILCPAINDLMLNVGETLHGFIWAHEPHSGHYSVGAGLWVGAHWSHHTERGWWYIGGSVAHGGALPPPPPPPLPPTTKRGLRLQEAAHVVMRSRRQSSAQTCRTTPSPPSPPPSSCQHPQRSHESVGGSERSTVLSNT